MSEHSEIVVIIRPSFKKICGDDPCRAAIFNHLLYWVAQKGKGQPESKVRSGAVCWYGSYVDICSTGLADSWSMWKVRKEIPLLIGSGIMGQRHNPTKGWDRKFQYYFGESQGKALKDLCKKHGVNLLEMGLPPDVVHLLKTANACAENSKCIDRKQQIHLLKTANPSAENSAAIPKITTKNTNKDNCKERESDIPNASPIGETSLSLSQDNSSSLEKSAMVKRLEERLAAQKKGANHA